MSRHRIPLSILLLMISLMVTVSGALAAAGVPELKIEKYTLANGLQVILHEDHTIPMAAVNIWYHVGSKNEKPGRTGFAHLFEHMMFQGSANYDQDYFLPLQNVGGKVNGSTNTDRTNYWENVPSDYLKRALFLEADRMGWLLPALTQEKLDNQRDVVKNEKRQGQNKPYARAREVMHGMLFPEGHPYRWLTIGSMDDLSAASKEDVSEFFALYYAPNNASLCVVGDFDPAEVKAWIAEYFGTIPPGRPLDRLTAWQPTLTSEKLAVVQDAVELPRLYMAWHTPGYYALGDAEFDLLGSILSSGKTSRLYQKLVYEMRIAQDVRAFQASREMSGVFEIRATAAPGHSLAELEHAIDTELALLLKKGVRKGEVTLAQTEYEASFVRGLQRIGGFGGKADRLNRYNVFAGDPDYLARDLGRYRDADQESIDRYARAYLGSDNRVVLHFVPQGELAVSDVAVDRESLPGSTGAVPYTPPAIQIAELENGLKLYLVEDHKLPMVEMRLNIMSGWSSDPSGRAGVAALTANLLDEGADGRDALELAHATGEIGARLSTSSSFDVSTVNLSVLKNHLIEGLNLMRGVVTEPTMAEADFHRIRQSYLGRQKQEANRPRLQAIKELQVRCFGADHPYAQPYTGTGTSESLALLSRDDLVAFHDRHYRPNNASLVVVGDLNLAEAVAWADEAFGDWQPGAQLSTAPVPVSDYTGARLVVIDRPGAQQSTIVGGYASMARGNPDFQAMVVVNSAFGGQFVSRINLNLREDKGYTYGARSELLGLRDGGLFLMRAPVETAYTSESLQELRAEMNGLRGDHPLAGDELAASRNRLTMGFPQQFQTCASAAASLSTLLQYRLPLDSWQTFTDRVGAMGEAEVAGVIERHLNPDRVIWVIVGDWQVIGPGLTALGLGEIEVIGSE